MRSEIQKPCHIKSRQMPPFRQKKHKKSRKKCLVFEWFDFQIVRTIALTKAKAKPFENWTILNVIYRRSRLSDFRYPLLFKYGVSQICIQLNIRLQRGSKIWTFEMQNHSNPNILAFRFGMAFILSNFK